MGVKIGLSPCGKIKVFESRVPWRISSSKNGEVTGRWEILGIIGILLTPWCRVLEKLTGLQLVK